MSQPEIRIPIKKTMYILGIIFFGLGTAIGFFISFGIDLQGEHVDVRSKGKTVWFQLLFTFIPENLLFLLIGISSAMMTYFLYKKLKYANVAITINSQGMIINVSVVKTGLIHWNEIRGLEIVSYGKQKYLCINIVNLDYLIKQQKRRIQVLLFINKLLGFNYPIAVPSNSIKMKLPELKRLIQHHQIQYRR